MSTLKKSDKNFLIVGVGNVYRGDDGAGILVARFLRRHFGDRVKIIGFDFSFEDLLDLWEGIDFVVLIDSIASSVVQAGKIYRIETTQGLIGDFKFYSTHSLGVAEYIELARSLGRMPKELIIYGISGGNFNAGDSISGRVKQACKVLSLQILDEIMRKISEC